MKQIATIMQQLIVLMVLAILPISLPAQTLKESANQLEQSVKELKKVADWPDQMVEWDNTKARYNDSIEKRNRLRKEVQKKKSTCKDLKIRYGKIEKLALGLRPDSERQAEAVLSRRYNATDVLQALQSLNPNADIALRLVQYEAVTNLLKAGLLESDMDKEKRRTYVSNEKRELYLRDVFGKIQDLLPPSLFIPESYPYLYHVLNEAMEAKMEDTSLNFEDIIKEKL